MLYIPGVCEAFPAHQPNLNGPSSKFVALGPYSWGSQLEAKTFYHWCLGVSALLELCVQGVQWSLLEDGTRPIHLNEKFEGQNDSK